jgi:hypothetical protein
MNPSDHVVAQATPADVRRQIRESLGLAVQAGPPVANGQFVAVR